MKTQSRQTTTAESDLLQRIHSPDGESVLSEVVEQHWGSVFRFCLFECQNEADAADCAQEIMVQVARNIAGFRGESSISTWIFAIGRRCVWDWKKRNRKHWARFLSGEAAELKIQSAPHNGRSPEQALELSEEQRRLVILMRQLPEQQRRALAFFFFEDLSVQQVAERMGCSEGSVKTHMSRGRGKLRKLLSEAADGQHE